ncbi:uncharacterized protein [Aristolochia californica]|uniref:uncharacterized protein n=1 Tax=Aristolochia californica TaxID=171875 RepID=UPI0035DC9F15
MAENYYVQPVIPKFDGHYDHWSMLMENFLRSEYWSLVETGIPTVAGVVLTKAQQKSIVDQKLNDLTVKNYLFQAIDRAIGETILNKNTAKHIWDSMKQKYQGSTRVKRAQLQALQKEYEVLQMKGGESVDTYFTQTLIIANKMKIHGENMQQVVIIEKILRSMTLRFDYVVCLIEESNKLDTLTIDELQSNLLVHEQRMNEHGRGDEQALKVTYDDRSSGRGGYSNHMCANKERFSDLDEEFRKSVTLGNNSKMAVLRKGNIRLQIVGVTQIWVSEFQGSENIAI